MKIMHLLSTNNFSGAENVVCQIIDMYKNEIQVYENDIERIKDEDYQKIDKELPENHLQNNGEFCFHFLILQDFCKLHCD